MRITRSASYRLQLATTTTLKKVTTTALTIGFMAGLALFSQNLIQKPQIAHAAATSEACFGFNSGTGTITSYYTNEDNNTANPACPKDVEIPSTIGGVSTVNIGASSFSFRQLTSVTIPNSVTNIANMAFRDNQLTSVIVPSGVTAIGDLAFENNPIVSLTYSGTTYTPTNPTSEQCFVFTPATGTIAGYRSNSMDLIKNNGTACLAEVHIPGSIGGATVTTVGSAAFYGRQITAVTLPGSVITIGDNAFDTNQLVDVTVPPGVASIGNDAFSNNKLTSATVPSSVTAIGTSVFMNNQLTTLPAYFSNPTVTTIPASTFMNNQIVSLSIPGNITTIGAAAFRANRLTSVTIPDSVTSIGLGSFFMNYISQLSLGSSLTSIPDGAFQMNKISTVVVPHSVASINPTAFSEQNNAGRDIEDYSSAIYLWSNNPAVVQSALDSIWYVRLLTNGNPNNLTSGIMSESWWMGGDSNNNGRTEDSLGGHVIDAASATFRFTNTSGTELAPSVTRTGRISEGIFISDYLVKNGPTIANPANPVELSVYQGVSSTVTFSPPAVSGYITPAPASLVLSANPLANTHTFVYSPIISSVNFGVQTAPVNVEKALGASVFHTDTAKDCSHIESTELLASSSFTAPNPTERTLGGLAFTLQCATAGGEAQVSIQLPTTIDSLAKLHVYKKDQTGTVTDVTSHVSVTQNAATKTISLSYNLTDGQTFDDDQQANGQILDPIYITVDADAVLASTGMSVWVIGAAGLVLLTASGLLFARRHANRIVR